MVWHLEVAAHWNCLGVVVEPVLVSAVAGDGAAAAVLALPLTDLEAGVGRAMHQGDMASPVPILPQKLAAVVVEMCSNDLAGSVEDLTPFMLSDTISRGARTRALPEH